MGIQRPYGWNGATTPVRPLLRLVPSLMAALGLAGLARAGNAPDPHALLQGVEASRLAIPSGHIEWLVSSLDLRHPRSTAGPIRLVAVFQGESRRFDQYQRILMTDGSGPDGGADARRKLEAMGGDWEAFVRAGLGHFEDVHIRTAFDGTQLLHYEGMGGANVGDLARGAPDYCLDPRIFGITVTHGKTRTISSCLAYRDARSVELVGPERVGGHSTWHVLVHDKRGSQRHFWVEDAEGFRVHRCEQIDDFGKLYQHWITQSEYSQPVAAQPLPVKTVTNRYDRDGRAISVVTFTQVRARYGVSVDPKAWTLAGLELPIGTPVTDTRIHRRIGHWDGEGLSQTLPEAHRKARPARWRPIHWGMATAGVIVAAVLAAALAQRRGWLRKGDQGHVA